MLSIDLDKSGAFRLHFGTHSCLFPVSEKGLECLHAVLFAHMLSGEADRAKIGTLQNPTQAIIDAMLVGEGSGGLQLAGQVKRWEDIEKATGVKVRKFNSRGLETNVTLEDLDL